MKITNEGVVKTVAFDSSHVPDGYERFYPLTFTGYYNSTGSVVTSNANDYLYTEIFSDENILYHYYWIYLFALRFH